MWCPKILSKGLAESFPLQYQLRDYGGGKGGGASPTGDLRDRKRKEVGGGPSYPWHLHSFPIPQTRLYILKILSSSFLVLLAYVHTCTNTHIYIFMNFIFYFP